MTVTVNADLNLIEDADLMLASMAQQPLLAALQNLNFLYADHKPALASLMPMTARYVDSAKAYIFGVIPSADGIKYAFQHRFWVPVQFDMEIKIETNTGTNPASGWTVIYTADHTLAANVLTTVTITDEVIAANITMIRVTYTQDEESYIPHHILMYPDADNPAADTGSDYPSGFQPFDDGMLSTGQHAPIHTELVDRCKTSALALYRDRRQMVFSMLTESSTNDPGVSSANDAANKLPFSNPYATLRAIMPGAPDTTTIDLRCLASVSGGATADLVKIQQVGHPKAAAVTLDATGLLVSDTLTVYPMQDGLARFVDLRISVKATTGNTTCIHSLVGWPQLVGA